MTFRDYYNHIVASGRRSGPTHAEAKRDFSQTVVNRIGITL